MFPADNMIKQSDDNLILESDELKVTLAPLHGGKIVSFCSKKTGNEFFFQDFRVGLDATRGYSFRDISGFDECFPNVATCTSTIDGRFFADHGFLWQKAWKTQIHDNIAILSTNVPEIECTFERSCQLTGPKCMELKYKINNFGACTIPYVYSTHPLLRCGDNTELELPPSLETVYNSLSSENYDLTQKTWAKVPFKDSKDLTGPYDKYKDTWVKLFTERLKEGRAVIHHHDFAESLEMTFDVAKLPHLGILISQGADINQDGNFKNRFLFAVEPTTGIGDDLATCEATGTIRLLKPGEQTDFWIRLRLLSS